MPGRERHQDWRQGAGAHTLKKQNLLKSGAAFRIRYYLLMDPDPRSKVRELIFSEFLRKIFFFVVKMRGTYPEKAEPSEVRGSVSDPLLSFNGSGS